MSSKSERSLTRAKQIALDKVLSFLYSMESAQDLYTIKGNDAVIWQLLTLHLLDLTVPNALVSSDTVEYMIHP